MPIIPLICCYVFGIAAAHESHSLLVVQQRLSDKAALVNESLDGTRLASSRFASSEAMVCWLRGIASGKAFARKLNGRNVNLAKQPGKRCAVVSNSGVLLDHSYGEEIDASDRIFRFNDAEIGGEFHPIVGSREDIRIVNIAAGTALMKGTPYRESGRVPERENATYLFIRHNTTEWANEVKQWVRETSGPVWVGTGESEKVGKNLTDLPQYSTLVEKGTLADVATGTMGIMVALAMCEEVRAYGFALTPASYDVPHHYYGKAAADAAHGDGWHETAMEEKDIWEELATNSDVDETDVSIFPGFKGVNCP